jgi:hypothetical protein
LLEKAIKITFSYKDIQKQLKDIQTLTYLNTVIPIPI